MDCPAKALVYSTFVRCATEAGNAGRGRSRLLMVSNLNDLLINLWMAFTDIYYYEGGCYIYICPPRIYLFIYI